MTEKEKLVRKRFTKDTLNIIRTTLRNNIDLMQLSDNKANTLLSLSALMLTVLFPIVLSNLDVIVEYQLAVGLIILVVTCFITIYMCALVLKPTRFEKYKYQFKDQLFSPFFFGNFYKMSPNEFEEYLQLSASDENLVRKHVAFDLHFYGTTLGKKMIWVRRAFNVFMAGLFLSISLTAVMLILYDG